eukprot:1867780-Rhodomonas_salina.3
MRRRAEDRVTSRRSDLKGRPGPGSGDRDGVPVTQPVKSTELTSTSARAEVRRRLSLPPSCQGSPF